MNWFEINFYWFLWTSSLGYAFYSFISDSKYLIELIDAKDVAKGWLTSGQRDVSDYEWDAIRHTFTQNLLYVFIYLVSTQLIIKYNVKSSLELNERQSFLFEVCMAWLNAKCLSLSIDRIRSQRHKTFQTNQLIQCVAYCLYLPAFFTGPIHQYNTFINDLNQIKWYWKSDRVVNVIKQVLRFTFWSFVFELMLHLVFSTSIQFYPELTQMFLYLRCGDSCPKRQDFTNFHNPLVPIKSSLELNERQSFLFEVCMAWLNAKCLSLSIDRIRSQRHKTFQTNQLIQCVAYCLYLPAFFTGPIHQYNTFIND
ncbi:unnamed protein product, partial [Medioppia subpectinata]